jgi:hypothetical protein
MTWGHAIDLGVARHFIDVSLRWRQASLSASRAMSSPTLWRNWKQSVTVFAGL